MFATTCSSPGHRDLATDPKLSGDDVLDFGLCDAGMLVKGIGPDPVEHQVVSPALVKLPKLLLDLVNGILDLLHLCSKYTLIEQQIPLNDKYRSWIGIKMH